MLGPSQHNYGLILDQYRDLDHDEAQLRVPRRNIASFDEIIQDKTGMNSTCLPYHCYRRPPAIVKFVSKLTP
jgi:hypothetical protein